MAEYLQSKLLDSFPNSVLVGIIREYNMGQSGSPVFAARYRPKNDYGLNGTFIVKIGSESWARTEQNFYNKFFSDNALAPLLTRLHMLSNSLEGQMAVAYDVAFDSVIVPKPLMTILDDKNSGAEEETQKQIENLSRALVNWYLNSKNSVVEDQHALILRMLTAKRTNDLLERLREALPFCNSDAVQITVGGLKQQLPNPLTYMKKAILKKIQYNPHCPISRIHGDLHTGNVICSPPLQQTPKVIDFDQSVEHGVPFFDLAYLEFDIMRHLLSVEQRENRKHWLSLLDFSMAKIGGGQENPSWVANGTWRFIQPIRQEVQRMVAVYGEDHEIVWWLSTVAVGLNFARKGDQTRSRFERMAGILYAAYGLDRILELFPLEEPNTEPPSFVPWIQGTGIFPLSLELPPSLPSSESVKVQDSTSLSTKQGKEKRTKIFISYSHKDVRHLERLHTHLASYVRDGLIDVWDDRKIAAGAKWREEIEHALETAKVAILLVSADFLASKFIAENELPPLLSAAKDGGARILPVILGPCIFEDSPLMEFQAINAPSKPLNKMKTHERDVIWVSLAKLVRSI